jgi:hypothetical protein
LIHGLVEVIVDLLALFVDHGAPLVDDLDLLALLPFDGDLEPLLVLADIINLLLEVHNEALHRIDEVILALQFKRQLVLVLPESLTV